MAGLSVAALGAAAAVATAVAVTAPSAVAPVSPVHKHQARTARAAANPVLAQLAATVKILQVKLPGNATLEIRNQSPTSDKPGDNGIDLYTDSGVYYWGINRSTLQQSLAQHQDQGAGMFKRDIAAALLALKGNMTVARGKMAVANYAPSYLKAAPSKKKVVYANPKGAKWKKAGKSTQLKLTPAQKAEHTDNYIWMNSIDALMAAPGNAKVRAGVLAIMATMPNVQVTHTTTAGQPTLTLADSWPLLPGPKGLVESLVINARTGFPVALFNRQPGHKLNATYYHTRRVTLSNVAAGKF